MKRVLHRLRAWLAADPYRLVLIALAIGYCALFTHLAWELHAGMRTHRSDLGQIDQAVWNSSRGRWLEQTDNGFVATRLTDHVEPILALVSPVLWLWNDVRALLLLQSLAAALGVLPLYSLALRLLEKYLTSAERDKVWRREPVQQLARPLAFALGLAYLLAPQLQSALLTEFHAAPLAVPLILWAFWAVDARRWGQFIAAALLTALVKEEMALLAAGLGAWAVWRAWWDGKEFDRRGAETAYGLRAGLLVLLLGLGWFAAATFVIVPAYAQPLYGTAESTYFARYGALGDSAADIFKSLLLQPQTVLAIAAEGPRTAYLLGLLAAFGCFSLLAPEVALLSLPLLLANLLSAYPAQYYGEFHYSAPLVAYFAAAAAYGVGRLWRFLARRTEGASPGFQHLPAANSGVMTAAALLQNSRTALRPLLTWGLVLWLLAWSGGNYVLHGRGPLGGRYDPTPVTDHHRLLERFTAQIPPDAPLTATAGVHPHVSHREYVYQFPLGLDAEWTPVLAEWALLDVTTNTDMAPGDLKAKVDTLLAADWGVVDAADGFLLLRRGATAKTIPPDFYTFTLPHRRSGNLPDSATSDSATSANLPAAGLRLLDITTADWPRWRQTKLVLDWQAGADFNPVEDAPSLEVVTPDGEVAATLATAAPPALIWLPPDQWQAGETVRVTTLPLTLPRVFAVRAAGDNSGYPALFVRNERDQVVQVNRKPDNVSATMSFVSNAAAAALARSAILDGGNLVGPVSVPLPSGGGLGLSAWTPAQVEAGAGLDVWLEWNLPPEAAEWPPALAAFVHLRRGGENVAQADGAPTWFGRPATVEPSGAIADWRRLTADCPVGETCQVVIGVYNPQTGARLSWLDANGSALGDELVLGTVEIGPPPMPDQAGALTGACE